jgi:hypothetical protein
MYRNGFLQTMASFVRLLCGDSVELYIFLIVWGRSVRGRLHGQSVLLSLVLALPK